LLFLWGLDLGKNLGQGLAVQPCSARRAADMVQAQISRDALQPADRRHFGRHLVEIAEKFEIDLLRQIVYLVGVHTHSGDIGADAGLTPALQKRPS